jgi:hypothetical protein
MKNFILGVLAIIAIVLLLAALMAPTDRGEPNLSPMDRDADKMPLWTPYSTPPAAEPIYPPTDAPTPIPPGAAPRIQTCEEYWRVGCP